VSDDRTADNGKDARVRILDERTLYEGFARYRELDVEERRADGTTHRLSREYQTRRDVVAVLPFDPVRQVALVARQLRVPVLARGDHDGFLIEAPAGYVDDGETPLDAARREAAEEVGVTLKDLEPVGEVYSSPGAMTERIDLFLGEYTSADRESAGGGLAHEGEEIEVLELPLARLVSGLQSAGGQDAKTLLLVQALMLRRPGLFA
jgi:nudix-type nucleoside diphosphatase (YffH/AdpP family)